MKKLMLSILVSTSVFASGVSITKAEKVDFMISEAMSLMQGVVPTEHLDEKTKSVINNAVSASMEDMKKFYIENYSEEDVETMYAFYSSNAYKRTKELQPQLQEIMVRSMQRMQTDIMAAMMPKTEAITEAVAATEDACPITGCCPANDCK